MRWLALILIAGGLWWKFGRSAAAATVGGTMTQAEIVALAMRLASEAGMDPADVLAVIEIESSFDPNAYRAEPQIGDASRGLMQLLLSTARDRGYAGDPDGLFDPETNIRLGIAQLGWIASYLTSRLGTAPTVSQWIGAYNGGVGNVLKGWVPLAYVNRFADARARWRERIAGA